MIPARAFLEALRRMSQIMFVGIGHMEFWREAGKVNGRLICNVDFWRRKSAGMMSNLEIHGATGVRIRMVETDFADLGSCIMRFCSPRDHGLGILFSRLGVALRVG